MRIQSDTNNHSSRSNLRSVTISILVIACVAAVTGPSVERHLAVALQRPGEPRRQRQCMSNLKHLWSATMMYAEDSNGWLPMYTNRVLRTEAADSVSKLGQPSPHLLYALLSQHVKSQSAFFCPSDRYAGKGVGRNGVYHLYSSYAYNFLKPGLLRTSGMVGAPPGSPLANPKTTPLIHDPLFGETMAGGCAIRGPHLGIINSVYMDGHGEARAVGMAIR